MYLIFLFIIIFILFIDIVTKVIAVNFDKSIIVIDNFFRLTYIENTGAAWGIGKNYNYIFVIISIIFLSLIFLVIYKIDTKYKNIIIGFAIMTGGIIGNLIDRIFQGYVVDFMDFVILNYNFPVFNFADISIVVGVFIIFISLFFIKENENLFKGP